MRFAFALCAALAVQACATRAPVAITNVRIFDGERVLPQRGVLLRGDRIDQLLDGAAPAGVTTIDGQGGTLLPGLIDSHVHVQERAQLERCLTFGVTTALDMFSQPALVQAMRAEERSSRPADRADLRSAGTLVTAPGGHGTEYGFDIPTLARAGDADAFVRARLGEGSDYVKIIYGDTGGKVPGLSLAEVAAVIRAAHANGKLAVVHVNTDQDALEALQAGADGLAHTYGRVTSHARVAEEAKARGAFVIPTLAVQRGASGLPTGEVLLGDSRFAPFIDVTGAAQLQMHFPGAPKPQIWDVASGSIRELKAAGVDVLAGTDSANPGTTHGASLHQELELLVQAGLTPVEALRAATSAPARRFHLEGRGRIAPGMLADLVLVGGDPTADILETRAIRTVWKGGVALDREERRAAAVRSRQVLPGGLVSDFEQPKVEARFGAGWEVVTDEVVRGSSKASMALVQGGAAGTRGALELRGEVASRWMGTPFAGAMFSPGPESQEPVNLGAGKSVRFWARGDGRSYDLLVFTARRGPKPGVKTFTASGDWAEHVVPLDELASGDATDVTGVWIGSRQPGSFQLQVDELRIQ